MSKFYNIKECFDACEDNDIPYIDRGFNSETMDSKKHLFGGGFNRFIELKSSLSDKWQIKRADPVVLDSVALALNWFNKYDDIPHSTESAVSMTREGLRAFAAKCRKNFRLERDLELRPVIEAAEKLLNFSDESNTSIYESEFLELMELLGREIANIKPLEEK